MKQKIYFSILFAAILIMISGKTFAQGAGNHLTMSLENCSQPAANIIQFDLFVMSDGVSTSDLRMSSCSYGINFDTCILPSGATITTSYVTGTTDSIFPSPAVSFPASAFRYHIRITQTPFTGGNNGVTMIIGHKYRFGTFRLTSTANYTNCCPNFSLQDTSSGGHTNTLGLVYLGSASTTTTFILTGTGDGQRSVKVINCFCTNGIDESNFNPLVSFFPNPATNALTVVFPEHNSKAEIKIINLLGEVKYSAIVNEQRIAIDVSSLSNGVYILEATIGNAVWRYKFVVNRFSAY